MIKNIVFDIGNVLVSFDPYAYFIEIFKDECKTRKLCEIMFQDESWSKYDQGMLQKKDLEMIYQEKYPEQKEELVYMLHHWEFLMKENPDINQYMKELKEKGYHLYVLSNISKDSADYLKKTQSFFSLIDGSILSYEYKIIKPDIRIYKKLFETYQLEPSTCIFLDDRKENIDMANKLGMKGIVYHDLKKAQNMISSIIGSEG